MLAATAAGCTSRSAADIRTTTRAAPSATAPAASSAAAIPSSPPASAHAAPHVMVIVEENHSFEQVVGNPAMPFFNKLASEYALATAYTGVSHPSEPNYLAMVSGSIWDNPADRTPADGTYPGPTVVDQLAGRGIGWKAYVEDLPAACDRTATYGPGSYDVNHNPFMYFDSIRGSEQQCANDVPFSQFTEDLSGGTAPPFIFVAPNTQHDMHDGTYQQADDWLAARFDTIFASQWYRQGGTVVITFDEGETSERVATVVVSAADRNRGDFTAPANHYGLLRGIESIYHLPYLKAAGNPANGDLAPLL